MRIWRDLWAALQIAALILAIAVVAMGITAGLVSLVEHAVMQRMAATWLQ